MSLGNIMYSINRLLSVFQKFIERNPKENKIPVYVGLREEDGIYRLIDSKPDISVIYAYTSEVETKLKELTNVFNPEDIERNPSLSEITTKIILIDVGE